MKKILISMALLLSVGSIMGQEDKAALKLLQKEAKAQMAEAQKIYEALDAKIKANQVSEDEIMSECKKGQALIRKAIKGGGIAENKLGEAYKLSADLALTPHNVMLAHASKNEVFDTLFFYSNLKVMTSSVHGELQNTKVTKGETGNEKYLKGKTQNLAQCGDYYIYAGQFNKAIGQFEKAIESYETAMNYTTLYPEVAGLAKLRISNEQIAYYAYHTAHEAKMWDKMDALYEQALQFADGAVGTKQTKVMSYQERGDTAAWASYVRDMTVKEPVGNEDYISVLIAYYMKQDAAGGGDNLLKYTEDIIASNPDVYIAHYGKAYRLFEREQYDEAFAEYKKCTDIEPTKFDSWYQCGLCKYKPALALNAGVSSIKNQVEAKKQLEKVKTLLGDAIPFFEKARECAPDEPTRWAYELRTCYSATGQADKAAEMDKLL